jgi:hypothetical protein
MYGERLEQELRDYFYTETKTSEPSSEWWDKAILRLPEQKRRSGWFGFVPKTRLAWVLLPLLLLVAGTVYGASTIIRELFQRFAGHVEKTGLVQELDLSQTINGVTVRLERAYADPNAVLLGYTVSGPKKNYSSYVSELSTADGQKIPGMLTMGTVPGSEAILGEWDDSKRLAVITTFDSSMIQGMSSEINLKLEIEVEELSMFGSRKSLVGPFILEFSLPLQSGKVIDVGQTAEAEGIPITLEKVVISPWVTQAVFQFHPPYDSNGHPVPIVSLELPTGTLEKSFLTTVSGYYFLGDFTDQHGDCTIVISELVFPPNPPPDSGGKSFKGKAEDTKRLSGPWVFHFTLP